MDIVMWVGTTWDVMGSVGSHDSHFAEGKWWRFEAYFANVPRSIARVLGASGCLWTFHGISWRFHRNFAALMGISWRFHGTLMGNWWHGDLYSGNWMGTQWEFQGIPADLSGYVMGIFHGNIMEIRWVFSWWCNEIDRLWCNQEYRGWLQYVFQIARICVFQIDRDTLSFCHRLIN